ncbi:M15 family metallopeptidase [Anoxynatronum buryatiense]|uniref:D-alanyl-D-alanine carboxypeptidase n=1 Tax=Anoxynatronum buryatiense TaxID=489973 RepID=A0AA45WV36_9CLOT|nr:M15 family metallopeptidase [Anoxynatronum buryatiense]SMP51038.1 D-alanyl-D-alanine carboxypeptidase [Anoxynatronum buryatiense]
MKKTIPVSLILALIMGMLASMAPVHAHPIHANSVYTNPVTAGGLWENQAALPLTPDEQRRLLYDILYHLHQQEEMSVDIILSPEIIIPFDEWLPLENLEERFQALEGKEIRVMQQPVMITKKPEKLTVIVNREHPLPEDYVPDNLVTPNVSVMYSGEASLLRKEAADALEEMVAAALEATGEQLVLRSGYRSYATQRYLFNTRARERGEAVANRSTARPGESEHQTGLAADITSPSVRRQLTTRFGETPEGKWLQENAHHYGFVLRYPAGKEEITGYIYEPWHFRYVGHGLATRLYESGLTMEEELAEFPFDS